MQITLNGEPKEVKEGVTVTALLSELGLSPLTTVVERNATLLDRASLGETVLADGDQIELVRFVGGG
jgi:thiamine biosynthesis protein ThiS